MKTPLQGTGFLTSETAGEHIRNALQILTLGQEILRFHTGPVVMLEAADFKQLRARLEAAVEAYEDEARRRRMELDAILAEQARAAATLDKLEARR